MKKRKGNRKINGSKKLKSSLSQWSDDGSDFDSSDNDQVNRNQNSTIPNQLDDVVYPKGNQNPILTIPTIPKFNYRKVPINQPPKPTNELLTTPTVQNSKSNDDSSTSSSDEELEKQELMKFCWDCHCTIGRNGGVCTYKRMIRESKAKGVDFVFPIAEHYILCNRESECVGNTLQGIRHYCVHLLYYLQSYMSTIHRIQSAIPYFYNMCSSR